jgi:hypothetical protein
MDEKSECKIKQDLTEFDEQIFDLAEEAGLESAFVYAGKGMYCFTVHNLEEQELVEMVLGICLSNTNIANSVRQNLLNLSSGKTPLEKEKMN